MPDEKPPMARQLARALAEKIEQELTYIQERKLPVGGYRIVIDVSPDLNEAKLEVNVRVANVKLN